MLLQLTLSDERRQPWLRVDWLVPFDRTTIRLADSQGLSCVLVVRFSVPPPGWRLPCSWAALACNGSPTFASNRAPPDILLPSPTVPALPTVETPAATEPPVPPPGWLTYTNTMSATPSTTRPRPSWLPSV